MRRFIENANNKCAKPLDWPNILTSPTNEYNTEGLLNMEFFTLFPTGDANWLHPHICNVEMHGYGLHLLKFYDQRFGNHPWFQYFLLNMIMWNHN